MVPGLTPRLVALDLDGTLLTSAETVTDRARAVLAALDARGVLIVLVTARPLRWMDALWSLAGATELAVVSNGAVVYDVAAGRVREVSGIERADGLALAAAITAAVPGAQLALETVDGLRLDERYDEPHPVPDGTPRGPLAEVWDQPVVKLMVRSPRLPAADLRAGVIAACEGRASVTWTMDGLMEVSRLGVTKAATLARVAGSLGVTAAEVVAFGDSATDIGMLRWAGASYAMASGHPDAIAAADHVAPGHDEDGVARVLEELFGVAAPGGGSP